MKNISLFFALLLVWPSFGQNAATQLMKNDYPLLMNRYDGQLNSKSAHYIFAVDISSSMRPYESVVKSSLLAFANAVPDGDQISIIRVASTKYTDYVNLFKCVTIDNNVRTALANTLYSPSFRFLTNGDPNDGSDGYTMAEKVIDAVNTVGSSDITFIYLFTDFEYWTRQNGYDKNKENWNSLCNKISNQHMSCMCKYGLDLQTTGNLRQGAIYKPEIDDIFNGVDFQAVSSAAVLSQWFNHLQADVMAAKLNLMFKNEWGQVMDNATDQLAISGSCLDYSANFNGSDLISSVRVSPSSTSNAFLVLGNSQNCTLGEFRPGDKHFLPGYKQVGGGTVNYTVHYDSPYKAEIVKLQHLCHETPGVRGAVSFDSPIQSRDIPSMKVWNSVIPFWAWGAIFLVLLTVLTSLIIQFFFMKANRQWVVSVTEKSPSGTKHFNGDFDYVPFNIGGKGELGVSGANWTLTVKSHIYNPLIVWKKSGYYVKLQDGTFAEIEDDYSDEPIALSIGQEHFLFALNKSDSVRLNIKEGNNRYIVDLS